MDQRTLFLSTASSKDEGESQLCLPGADGWRKVALEDFEEAVDRNKVLWSMSKTMDYQLKFMDVAILRCMSAVKCKETLKELLEEIEEWERDAKAHMAIIFEF